MKVAATRYLGKYWHILLTCLYVGFFAGLFWKFSSNGGVLELNALGDFLAGVVGPLALFWLVLGFFQQGQELRNSVLALDQQAKQLKRSADEQDKLAKINQELVAAQVTMKWREIWMELLHTEQLALDALEETISLYSKTASTIQPTISGFTHQTTNLQRKEHLKPKLEKLNQPQKRANIEKEKAEKLKAEIYKSPISTMEPESSIDPQLINNVYQFQIKSERWKSHAKDLLNQAETLLEQARA